MDIKRPVIVSIIALGLTSIITQIVVLREFIAVFYGNELSIGIILAVWLFLGALGSLLPGRLPDKILNPAGVFCACQILLAAALPFLPLLIHNIRHIFNCLPGEVMPLWTLTVAAPLILAPVCITLGFLFALSCSIFPEKKDGHKIARAYIFESIGATAGGILSSFLLIRYLDSTQILTLVAAINLSACTILAGSTYPPKLGNIITRGVSIAGLLIIATLFLAGGLNYLEKAAGQAQWRPLKVVSSRDSIYGNVTVTAEGALRSFFVNGLHNFTVPDILWQEESVHFPFSEHNAPQNILLVGGGAGGLLWEMLKYPVKRIDYVELDPLIIKFARLHLRGTKYYALDNPKVRIINTDGRFFIKNTANKYDIIIISIPAPYTAQLNRFYTTEFFGEAKTAMTNNGILSFGITSSENYINAELGNLLSSIYNSLKEEFPDVTYIPGDTAYFMASVSKNSLTNNYKKISGALSSRGIKTGYMNAGFLSSKLSEDRIRYMGNILRRNRSVGINRDFKPISYYYDMTLWSVYSGSHIRSLSKFFNVKFIWSFFIMLSAIIMIYAWASRRQAGSGAHFTLAVMGVAGFSGIAFEILIVLSFQIIYGYLYYKLGLILTSFMLGLTAGSIFITKRLGYIRDLYKALTATSAASAMYSFILPLLFVAFSHASGRRVSWLNSNIIFLILPFAAGTIGGAQFPLVNSIRLRIQSGAGKVGGVTYGIDLAGACLGAWLLAAFVIPLVGIFQALAAVGLLNLSILISLLIIRSEKGGNT